MKNRHALILLFLAISVSGCLIIPAGFVPADGSRLLNVKTYKDFYLQWVADSLANDSLAQAQAAIQGQVKDLEAEVFSLEQALAESQLSAAQGKGLTKRKDSLIIHLQDSVRLLKDSVASMQVALDKKQIWLNNMKGRLDKAKKENAQLKKTQSQNQLTAAMLIESSRGKSVPQKLEYRKQVFDTYIVDLNTHEVQLHWKNSAGHAYRNVARLRKDKETIPSLLMGMNAGMYKPDGSPQGLYIEKGQELVAIDTQTGKGNFYLKPNGVFYLSGAKAGVTTTEKYQATPPQATFATQSGPMLLIDGKVHPAFNEGSKNTYVRNGVGIISESKIVFAISTREVNFYDFAMLFKEQFGCKNALYLDGAISKMHLPVLLRQDLGGQLGPLVSVTPKK